MNLGEQVYLLPPGGDPKEVLSRLKGRAQVSNGRFINPKPKGRDIVWTSSLKGTQSEWLNWCRFEMPEWIGEKAVIFEPTGKIAYIRNRRDLLKLMAFYPWQAEGRFAEFSDPGIDWVALSKDYDAVWHDGSNREELYGWEVESTAWFNPSALKFKRVVGVEHNDKACQFRVASSWLSRR